MPGVLRLFQGSVCLLAVVCVLSPPGARAQQVSPSLSSSSPSTPTTRQRRRAEKFYAEGVRAMEKGDVEAAEQAFEQASKADPADRNYALDFQIAREHRVTRLIQDADKARLLRQPDVARAELAEALSLDPQNPEVSQHIYDLAALSGNPDLSDTVTASLAPPIELTPKPGRLSFHIRGTETEVLRRVCQGYGISMVADSSLGSKVIHFDVDDVDFAHAAYLAGLATNSFLVPLDPLRVLAAKESKENHEKYDRLAVETLRLPGLQPVEFNDMSNLAKNVLGITQAVAQPQAGTLTVRAPAASLDALNKTFSDLLDGRSEVLLDVKIYEVDKTRTGIVGLQLPGSTTVFNVETELNSVISQNSSLVQQIIASGLANAGDYAAIAAILIASGEVSGSILSQPFALFGGGKTLSGLVPGSVTGNLSLNATDARSLDQVQIRLDDQEEGTIRSGTRYPITTSSYSSIAAQSVSVPGISTAGYSSLLSSLGVSANSLSTVNPIPQVQYQDLGLIFKATPRIERNDDIVLKLDLKIQALAGSSLNGLPLLTNRSYTANIRLVNGASALVIGDLSRQESNAVNGTAGLSELPGFSPLSNTTKEYDVSNLAILVTPHILRRRHDQQVGPLIPLPRHG